MSRARRWVLASATLIAGRVLRRRRSGDEERSGGGRVVPAGWPDRRAENLVAALLIIAALFAAGFIATYALYSPRDLPNELLGLCIGLSLACIALAFGVFARRLIVTEELEEDYPQEHPEDQQQIAEIVRESGSRITRRRLLLAAGGTAGGALGLAALAPALSLGPLWYTEPLLRAPWRRGSALVNEEGRPYGASDIEEGTFYTAFPRGANTEELGAPVVVVRLAPGALRLPPGRATWAPLGILAYSKICTHAGCAISLYRKPTFRPLEPEPALVCPCHYSTFNPATGGTVIFGPAGRPLPQLPLMLGTGGALLAAGNLSGPVGPAWGGARWGRAR